MKLAGTVILYHPDKALTARLKTYIDILDVLYVVDNTEHNDIVIKEALLDIQKIKYLHDGKNNGIAARLNQVAKLAIMDGHSFLLTMDQDSCFDDTVQQYKACISTYAGINETAMFGVEFLQNSLQPGCSAEIVSELITSGSMINLSLFHDVGGFDEKLFIDYVDHEYCYRSILKGYGIIKFSNIFLQHKVGEAVQKRSFSSLKYTERSFHSSVRLYYMVRNYFYVKATYETSFRSELNNQRKSILTRIKNKLLYGNDRIALLKLIFRAYRDYRNGKMGGIEL